MTKGKLDNGFEFECDEEKFNNMEFLDDLADADAGDSFAVSRAVRYILGKEQKKVLYDVLRTEDGRVPIEDVIKAVQDILEQCGDDTKN